MYIYIYIYKFKCLIHVLFGAQVSSNRKVITKVILLAILLVMVVVIVIGIAIVVIRPKLAGSGARC